MPNDITFACPPGPGDVHWAGWEATLIQRINKHKVPLNDYDGKLPDEAKSAQASQSKPVEVDEQKRKIAEVVAAAGRLVAESIRWRCMPRGIFRRHRVKVWRSIINYVLSIIDVDVINVEAGNKRDVINVESGSKRLCEYRKLFSKLNSFVHADEVSKEEVKLNKYDYMFNKKFHIKAMNLIAGDVDGASIGPEYFVGLSEGDVALLIRDAIQPTVTESMVGAWVSSQLEVEENISSKLVELVLEEMEAFVPLKEDREMQLAMELSGWRCNHVVDYLFVEACNGFMSKEFFTDLDQMLDGTRRTSEDVLSIFLESLYNGFWGLRSYKANMLIDFSECGITFPLTQGAFGHFSKEATEAVQIANHARRCRGRRFIGLRDILFGLSCAGYLEDFNAVGLQELPEMPPYRFYKRAWEFATKKGVRSVQIEHLVWAFLYIAGRHEEAAVFSDGIISSEVPDESKRVSAFTATFTDAGLLHKGKPICGYKALVAAIKEGLNLPRDFRMEHKVSGGDGGTPYFRPMDLCI